MKWRSTGDDDPQPGRAGEEIRDERRRGNDLLEVVEHEEQGSSGREFADAMFHVAFHLLSNAQGGGYGGGDHRPIPGILERDEEGAIGEIGQHALCRRQCQSCLAGAAGTRERDQSMLADEPGDLRQLPLPPDERGRRERQIVGPGVQRSDRRELGLESLDVELPDPFGRGQVLEPMLGQVAKAHALGQILSHEDACGIGQQDLPAVSGGRDPGGTVDVDPDVVVAAEAPLASVQAHPDPEAGAVRPGCGMQLALGAGGGLDGLDCRWKHREERVALRTDLNAVVRGDRAAQDLGMGGQEVVVVKSERRQQAGRPLDVGEQECDRSRGQRFVRRR